MVLGSGPDGRTKYFYLSAENASNTGFWAGGKHLATLSDHVISQKSMLTIFKKVCCSGRDANSRPWVYSTKVKIIVARYPLHYWDINNWWWIFRQVRKLMYVGHYRHFVFFHVESTSAGAVCTTRALVMMTNAHYNPTYRLVLFKLWSFCLVDFL